MASIRQRAGKWQARIARKEFPVEVKTFDTKVQAQTWARRIESSMDNGSHQNSGVMSNLLLCDVLQRYMDEVTPSKRGAKREAEGIRFMQRKK